MTDEQKKKIEAHLATLYPQCRNDDGTWDVHKFRRLAHEAGYKVIQTGNKVRLIFEEESKDGRST